MTRVGLVGFGMAGATFHAPLLQAAGLEIVAVSTANPQRAAEARAAVPDALIVADLAELLESTPLDLVVIASPSGHHVDNARATLEAGVATVVDKPLACDASAALGLIDDATELGVPLTVFQNRRYDPEFCTLRRILADGEVGEVYRTEFRWERWRPTPPRRWREAEPAESGGGLLLDLHTHLIDQAVQLFGPVDTVYAEVEARTTRAEDDTFLALRHTSGAVTHVGASSVAGAPGPRIRVLGRRGAYVLGSAGDETTAFPDANSGAGHHGWVVRGEQRKPVVASVSDPADFYRDVAAALTAPDPQASMPVDPRDAVHVLAVVDAARISGRDGRVVEVITPGQAPT